jgi:cytochrome b561
MSRQAGIVGRTSEPAMTDLAQRLTTPGYTLTARVLHWLTAALVLFQIPAGLLIVSFDLGFIYNLHKSVGVVILAAIVVRLPWRLTHPAPPLPADIPAAQRLAAQAMHWALYGLLVVQPILGWIATSAYPAPVPFFGLFEMPHIWWADRALSDRLFVVHRWLGIAMGALLVGHIGAALYHHFIRRDGVLLRMVRG